MLDWCIDYMKNKHAGFKFKKQHQMKCADSLNKEFAMGVTDRARHLLSKPIKFFYEMQELFVGTNSDDSQGLNDMSGNALPEDLNGDDSNTLPSPLSNKPGGESSSCTSQVGTKRPRGSKSPSKKPKKPKSHFSESTEQLNSTLLSLQKFLNAPAPQVPQPPNPHASLWERLEAMTITTYNKITVCQYLAHNDRKGLRDFLSSASDTTLQTWVYKFLTGENY
ncbi:hypothetical protein SETIT_6G145900v2 [Setaria italica]|uniref:Uncharacterized protein n=1 Tax=Setaria italica TaxID=4555 RepID=A0A368RLU0_SETIT|nr:hypothetical protein SETIT_6G145900v2 [Setaria italica]